MAIFSTSRAILRLHKRSTPFVWHTCILPVQGCQALRPTRPRSVTGSAPEFLSHWAREASHNATAVGRCILNTQLTLLKAELDAFDLARGAGANPICVSSAAAVSCTWGKDSYDPEAGSAIGDCVRQNFAIYLGCAPRSAATEEKSMTTCTLRKERRGDQIMTYVLIERSPGRGLRTTLLILLLLGAVAFLAVGGAKRLGTAAMNTLFETAPFRSR